MRGVRGVGAATMEREHAGNQHRCPLPPQQEDGATGVLNFDRTFDSSLDLAFPLRRRDPFRPGPFARYDMKGFVNALLATQDPSSILDEFILHCARETHVQDKLMDVLDYPFNSHDGTFEDLTVPLLAFLTSPALSRSPHATDVRLLFRVVSSCPTFFTRVLDCLEVRPRLDVPAMALATLLLTLAKTFPKRVLHDETFYGIVYRGREWSRRVHASCKATLDAVMALFDSPSRQTVPSQAVDDDGFGRGPRHDNDAERIEEIQVLPTDDEMRCAETPFLPLRPPPTAGFDAHVAFHFRLMREDILAQMRRGLQWWLHPATDRTVSTAKHVVDGVPRLHVATGVSMSKLHGSIHKGLLFQLTVPQPWTGKSKGQLKILWERDARYSIGSLVCLATQVQMRSVKQTAKDDADAPFPRRAPMACDRLVFATVAARDPALLVANSATFAISVKLIKPHETIDVVRAMNQGLNVLLEVRNLFFTGYEPILRALQRREALSPRLASCLYGGDQGGGLDEAHKPEYLERDHYDCQFLVKKDRQRDRQLGRVPGATRAQLADHLRANMDDIVLDETQIDAFAAAMTQDVCLIQGPPGTGKSYVGTKIVHGILKNSRRALGPILVVCYTNHALDQFLEALVGEKIVPLGNIVRVGGRSKSTALKSRTLHALRQTAYESREENHAFRATVRTCKEIENNTLKAFDAASDERLSLFMRWLGRIYPDELAEICGELEDDEGFAMQGGVKAQEKHFRQWEAGDSGCFVDDVDEYEARVQKIAELSNAKTLRLLKNATVVGMTTTGCAMHQDLVRCLAPHVVMCEEAGEVLEAHLLSCLTSATQHVIQIGDHKQLRPLVSEFKLSAQAGNGFDLDISMFERLVEPSTKGAVVTLYTQRRMRPEICDLVRYTLYQSLQDGPSVSAYPPLHGFAHPLWFCSHEFPESKSDVSLANPGEADFVVELVMYAIKQGHRDVAVLTPYLGQLVLLRNRLAAKHVWTALEEKDEEALAALVDDDDIDEEDEKPAVRNLGPGGIMKSLKDCVRLSTVDNFQGNEADFVIVSTVRSNKNGQTGFLKVLNRVNVMLSRAKHAMLMLGSESTIRQCSKAKMFNNVLDILEDKNLLGNYVGLTCLKHAAETRVTSAQEMLRLVPDGGCQLACDMRLPCGHACTKLCHADDISHVTNVCLEPCSKAVARCGHLCRKKCHEPCVCAEVVPLVSLECGHVAKNVPCSQVTKRGPPPCTVKISVAVPGCGHTITVDCPTAIQFKTGTHVLPPCRVVCGVPRACSHVCTSQCHDCRGLAAGEHAGPCRQPCGRTLVCGHACPSFCHPANECPPCEAKCGASCCHSKCPNVCKDPCASCAQPCVWTCKHQQTTCPLPCGSPCIRLPCDERCDKLLDCGHQCPGLCGEAQCLPQCCRYCASADQKRQVVDFVMQTTLAEHDPTESPLVELTCGHCFAIETMDGHLGFGRFYRQDTRTGQWTDVEPLTLQGMDGQKPAVCPLCRRIVKGVMRYGRVLHFQQLYASELKYLHKMVAIAESSRKKRVKWATQPSRHQMKKWLTQLEKQCDAPAPSQEMAVKELHCLVDDHHPQVNLNGYRNTMQSAALLLVHVELFEMLLVCISMAAEAETKIKDKLVQDALELETASRALCRSASSFRTEGQLLVLGMKVRLILVESAAAGAKQALVDDMEALVKATPQQVPRDFVGEAIELIEKAKRALNDGPLTKEEKTAIFQVFARDSNGYNSGFGGNWYACPNGHPYVITECGGAMQEYHCPECGARIGGSDHHILDSNQTAEAFFTAD
ncbi:Aste57867_17945 [Aphanomyces stellatus]|uniref:Aste57867_17945 protein n=1 Tax=Aphanomyces stellatus TaxID=120398 RepID=A0A485L952_9STRA|nr:hypothetical protein As57867_017883 [Aphanomyces stellatus]VFT94686.1 Aste57867_17945 [Aphanomyces stellatus]